MTQDRKSLLVAILLAAIFPWGYYAYVLMPVVRTVWRMGQEVQTLRSHMHDVEQAIVQEPQLRQQYRQLSGDVQRVLTMLPIEAELPAVIERVSDLASQTGVKIQFVSPQRPPQDSPVSSGSQPSSTSRPTLYKEIPIDIDAVAGFHQLGTFVSRIELGEQPMQLRALRISQNPKMPRRHLVKMTIVAYALSSSMSSMAGQKHSQHLSSGR